jgi:hypothetical protein
MELSKSGLEAIQVNGGTVVGFSYFSFLFYLMSKFLSLRQSRRCIHTFDDLISTSVPEDKLTAYPVDWSPNGDYLAVAGMGGCNILKSSSGSYQLILLLL